MSDSGNAIVAKVWGFCRVLLDDGVSYGDYVEQLTYLLFLKMADEYSRPPHNRKLAIPEGLDWQSLRSRKGAELEAHYIEVLRGLATAPVCSGRFSPRARTSSRTPQSSRGSST
jgi:type I restriction enzyme M protein